MTNGLNPSFDWPANPSLEQESHALRPERADDHVDFRRSVIEGTRSHPATDGEVGKKTDDQILDLVHQALKATGYGQLRRLCAYCDNGRVTLQGRVPTYYLKQVAHESVNAIPGVRDIDNDLKVTSPR